MRFSKFVVLFILSAAVIFTATVLVLTTRGWTVPDSLIASVFVFLGGEAGFLSWIKRSENNNDEQGVG